MNLIELKSLVDRAIENAEGFGEDPKEILVFVQIDDAKSESLWSDDIELTYDNDCNASGCVLHGWTKAKHNKPLELTTKCDHCDGILTPVGYCPTCNIVDLMGRSST